MTAVPRDPDFWRRFSVAVHRNDLENSNNPNDRAYSEQSSHLLQPVPSIAALASTNASSSQLTVNDGTSSYSSSSHHIDLEKQQAGAASSAATPNASTLNLITGNGDASRGNNVRGGRQQRQERTWLQAERSKQRRSKWLMPIFVLGVVALIVLVVLLLIWLSSHGWFANGEKVTLP